ncbi:MAG: hypothetical protein ACTHJ8_13915 [Mucilaginibacter sp.]
MHNYINGAIREAIGKGRVLMAKIPGARELGLYFTALATTANREIEQIINELDYLYNDQDYNDPRNIRQKFLRFKQLSGKLSDIENVVIAAMSRKDNDDEFVNKLVFEICKEINYPLQNPVASCLSQKYYHIYPAYNLLCIPLLESEFVLHIPDIYHELGHPLLQLDNPKTLAFQHNLGYFNIAVRQYFDDEIKRRELNKTTTNDFDSINVWKDCWLENWSMELFCDLFATFMLGPAYLWSNLHMCTKMSWEIFKTPIFQKMSHPPDEARMRAIFYGLELIGFAKEAVEVKTKWDEFKDIIGQKMPQDFPIALPDQLLKKAAEFCLTGTQQIGCEIAQATAPGKVNKLLNESWKQFWVNPENFYEWERQTVADFKKEL